MESNNVRDQINESNDHLVTDYTDIFTTNIIFESKEKMIDWVRDAGKPEKMVIIVKRSDNDANSRRPRVTLACERSGVYHETKKKVMGVEEVGVGKEKKIHFKNIQRRRTGTKKCDCQFQLRGYQIDAYGRWKLEVVRATHNHPLGRHLEGHSFFDRLTPDQETYVRNLSKANTRPRDILAGLGLEWNDNAATIRTVYNCRQKHRVVEHKGASQLQYLMQKLKDNDYSFHHRRCETTNVVKDLFFAHSESVALLHAFPDVLMMDCTYKTNRYKLPLLEIVGVTSTGMTFSVAFAYMKSEREDNYLWACDLVKKLMHGPHGSYLPRVIITDRELTLVNAIANVFPTSRHFLCRWHISKNILTSTKKKLLTKDLRESFIEDIEKAIRKPNEVEFNDALRQIKSTYSAYPKAYQYFVDQWLPYKELFVYAWTNNVMHYHNTTTNRVESTHSRLKQHLKSSQGNFETCWVQIHSLLHASHNAIKASFENSINVLQHIFSPSMFKILRGEVSIEALDKILDEMKRMPNVGLDSLMCGCRLRKTCGLPCAHKLNEFSLMGTPILLESIDVFWKKMDMRPREATKTSYGVAPKFGPQWYDTIKEVDGKFVKSTETEQLLMLKRLREVGNPETTSLIPPAPLKKPRGRPKGTRKKKPTSTKRDPSAFEFVIESLNDNSVSVENPIYFSGTSSVKPMFSNTRRKKEKVVRRKATPQAPIEFINHIPHVFREYVVGTTNVLSDGNCGYRAVAHVMGFGEEAWAKVRRELIDELRVHKDLYTKVFIEDGACNAILNALDFFDPAFAPEYYWFTLPEMGYLVASVYNVVFVTLSNTTSNTFMPLRSTMHATPQCKCIALLDKSSNFIAVSLRLGHPLPHAMDKWYTFRDERAKGWDTWCQQGFLLYNELVGESRDGDNVINLGD